MNFPITTISDHGLASNKQQNIIWTNDGKMHWFIQLLPAFRSLKSV